MNKKTVSIACQGGGSHGAFTWGVLDEILSDGKIEIEAMTGTSAGAMNCVALIQGLIENGHQGAIDSLKDFWHLISESGKNSPINNRGFIDKALNKWTMYNSLGFTSFNFLSKMFTPKQLNPLGLNVLKDVVEKFFDFELIKNQNKYKLFLCATNIKSGTLKVFQNKDLSTNVMLASACLPTMFEPVKVDNEYYWDGGFIGNPLFFPLINETKSKDIIFIQLNPTFREDLPNTAHEISDRLNEITNNVSVIREMRAINFIADLQKQNLIKDDKLKHVKMHLIKDDKTFSNLGWSSKLNTEKEFLNFLYQEGKKAARSWILKHFGDIGVKSSINIEEEFMQGKDNYHY